MDGHYIIVAKSKKTTQLYDLWEKLRKTDNHCVAKSAMLSESLITHDPW